ncbi:MAG: vWA domain-containing protein [Solirubrobacterales bacterium]
MKCFKKKTAILLAAWLVISLLNFSNAIGVFAEDNEYTSKVDVVFLMDASKSMDASDPEGIASEAMKMYIDMCHVKGDKGGMVAYSGDIIKESPLMNLNSEGDKTALKGTLTNIQRGEWTDIGLGLKRAVTLLKEGQNKNYKPIIIMLSDGKNDPKRDKTSSLQDITSAINEAKNDDIQVYTIGLNADGSVDKNQLETISRETGGKSFITNYAKDLPQILREIYADNSSLKISQQNTITGNDKFQDIKINIPDSNVVEANITILSSKSVELNLSDTSGNVVNVPSEKVLYTKSLKYSMLKLVSPAKGTWTLKVKGSMSDQIDISLIDNYDFNTAISINPEKEIHKGDKVAVVSYIQSNGKKLEDADFIKTLKGVISLKNNDTGEVKEFPMSIQDNEFVGEITLPDDKRYELISKIEGTGFTSESKPKNIGALNRAPVIIKKNSIFILWNKNIKNIDLAEYFTDQDNDKLNYEFSASSSDTANLLLNGNTLEIQGKKLGLDNVKLIVHDGKGGTTTKEIKVFVCFAVYVIPGTLAVIIILTLIVLMVLKRNRKVNASLNGQIMIQIKDEETGKVDEPKFKNLNSFGRSFTVFDLLDPNPEYEEMKKIFVMAGEKDEMLLMNNSNCTLMLNDKEVSAFKGLKLKDNDIIKIISSDKKFIVSLKYYRWNSTIFVESLFHDSPIDKKIPD